MNIFDMTALEIGAAIKAGSLTAPEAAKQALDAAEAANGKVNAYITICREQAMAQAEDVQKRIEAGELTSPLAGVPFGIKDNICTKGIKTTAASHILGEFAPVYDAFVMQKLNAAGAVTIGKLNMDEFAMGSTSETSYYGATHNPWDLNKVPGGSSGGAAAAVAGNMAPITLGSDTGGSIRQPASYCGVTGFKPTYGTVSRFGLIAYASSLDQIGPVGRDAKDCAAVMDIISGKDEMDGTSLEMEYPKYLESLTGDVKGLKIGLPKECYANAGLDPEVAEKTRAAAEKLRELGAEVEEISMPFLDYVIPAYYIIAAAEASSNLSRFDGVKYGFRSQNYSGLVDMYNATRSEGFGKEVKKRILLGTFVLSSGYYDAYYRKALKVKAVIKKHFDEIFSKYDLILCPVAPTTAPEIGKSLADPLAMYLSDIFTVSVNIAGLPGISMPCGFDRNNMPIGAQLIGPALGDTKVLNAAYAYQQATDFHKQFKGVQ
ncbi:MAG: Asp-tRNA(Asn)/Glu-tRNA(Gln) amidotransferase subunit GatA [Oscillospiraceae bacterium]|nr:Asp-tRNA(Asn)/Glu-tRNA(Gln) amidotransferase subunit GatA [Oscillospiraceae bacterium]